MATNTDRYRAARDQLFGAAGRKLRRREEAAHRAGSPITTEYRYEDLLG